MIRKLILIILGLFLARGSSAQIYQNISLANGKLGPWGLFNKDGAGRPTPPFLTTLGNGEGTIGEIQSPEFIINVPTVSITLRGWSGSGPTPGGNISVQLVNAENGQTLISVDPPQQDAPKLVQWNTTNFQGQRVFIRINDDDNANIYAWIGLDAIDAGPAFQVSMSDSPDLSGWSIESLVTESGIPFKSLYYSILPENQSIKVNIGRKANNLFFLGMTNSIDNGCPVWGDPLDRSQRFYVGDTLGNIKLKYTNGRSVNYPLILGSDMWWGKFFDTFPEPFTVGSPSQQTLKETLRLYPPYPTPDGRYIAILKPDDTTQTIDSVEIIDYPEKKGTPVILGLTLGLAPDTTLSSDIKIFIKTLPMLPAPEQSDNLNKLKDAFYTTESNLPSSFTIDIPTGYRGPKVQFLGSTSAELLTNIFYNNVNDMDMKVTQDGMYHTSSLGSPSWGDYQGFGTYKLHGGLFYSQAWSRDLGRSLMELTELGFLDKAKLCADYCLQKSRLWPQGYPALNIQGQVIPAHFCRIINQPSTGYDQGDFENDGHGLISLFLFKLWQRLPDRDSWLNTRWNDIQAAGDWIVWQFNNPQLSGADGKTLETDSECSGGYGRSIFADFLCMQALNALSVMAVSIGKTDKANEWQQLAGKMKAGIEATYIINDPVYGKVWTANNCFWPNQGTVLSPLINQADLYGFDPKAEDDTAWRALTLASYQKLVNKNLAAQPFGFYGTVMGYGQGFVSESALLFDRMEDADKMLEWTAKAVYNNFLNPYIVPEGCEMDPKGRFWFRTGDLGNGVQQAEIVKSLRLVIGVDDADPNQLRLYPRMPLDWTQINIGEYPALIKDNGGLVKTVNLNMSVSRGSPSQMTLRLAADTILVSVEVRLGAFAPSTKISNVNLNGKPVQYTVEISGDSKWVLLNVPAGMTKFKVEVNPDSTLTNQNNTAELIYPNPTTGIFTIKLNNYTPADQPEVYITDIKGQRIVRKQILSNETKMEISSSGVYFVSLINRNKKMQTFKLIVIK